MHMTVRITVSLPDDVHAALTRIADASNVSGSAVVRTILSDALPRMTSVLDYLGAVKPEDAPRVTAELDAWAEGLRAVVRDAPDALGPLRTMLDPKPEDADE